MFSTRARGLPVSWKGLRTMLLFSAIAAGREMQMADHFGRAERSKTKIDVCIKFISACVIVNAS